MSGANMLMRTGIKQAQLFSCASLQMVVLCHIWKTFWGAAFSARLYMKGAGFLVNFWRCKSNQTTLTTSETMNHQQSLQLGPECQLLLMPSASLDNVLKSFFSWQDIGSHSWWGYILYVSNQNSCHCCTESNAKSERKDQTFHLELGKS